MPYLQQAGAGPLSSARAWQGGRVGSTGSSGAGCPAVGDGARGTRPPAFPLTSRSRPARASGRAPGRPASARQGGGSVWAGGIYSVKSSGEGPSRRRVQRWLYMLVNDLAGRTAAGGNIGRAPVRSVAAIGLLRRLLLSCLAETCKFTLLLTSPATGQLSPCPLPCSSSTPALHSFTIRRQAMASWPPMHPKPTASTTRTRRTWCRTHSTCVIAQHAVRLLDCDA